MVTRLFWILTKRGYSVSQILHLLSREQQGSFSYRVHSCGFVPIKALWLVLALALIWLLLYDLKLYGSALTTRQYDCNAHSILVLSKQNNNVALRAL